MKYLVSILLLFSFSANAQIISIQDSSGYLKFVNPLDASVSRQLSVSSSSLAGGAIGSIPYQTAAIGTGGTLTPQINFSANPGGTNLMKAGSFLRLRRLGVNTFSTIGAVN